MFKKCVIIIAACMLYALAVAVCLEPHTLASGGVSGLAILLTQILPLEAGEIIFLINLPLLLIGTWKFGKSFAAGTVFSTLISSAMILYINKLQLPPAVDDPYLAAICGGVLQAAGLGLIFRCGATTGGTDVIVHLILMRYQRLSTGMLFLIIDSCVIVASWFIIGDTETTVCAAVALVVCSLLMDVFLLKNRNRIKQSMNNNV